MMKSLLTGFLFALGLGLMPNADLHAAAFRAGAAAVDVSPLKFPVIVNGGFLAAKADKVHDRLYARCLVLDDGKTKLAVMVADSCMMPRDLLDKAKQIAHEKTGIAVDHILISATHTHSAPSTMDALGTPPDPDYVAYLPAKLAEAVELASKNLTPAKLGWSVINDYDHTHTRRWIRRPDKLIKDPFGDLNVRANMHPGHQNPDVIAPSGPVDPGLSVISVQTSDGRPLALIANYSMHYFGTGPVSADYYGRFVRTISKLVGASENDAFVGMMTQGTSGDQQWMDYSQPKSNITMDAYADAVATKAFEAYRSIKYHDDLPISMAEAKLTLSRRLPTEQRLAWAREVIAQMKSSIPTDVGQVYAKEAVAIHESPIRELKLQAIRIGELGITAIPDEVYAITGLKLKAMSPLKTTVNIELANGSEGYIPPPEQHSLGGYTTWPARTAGLEVQAEPQIVETLLTLLETVSSKPRHEVPSPGGAYRAAILASKPILYWPLDEIQGTVAIDRSGHHHHGIFEPKIAHYLEGPSENGFSSHGILNRAPHFAGGRLKTDLIPPGSDYSLSLWFWNGLLNEARGTTGHIATLASETISIGGRTTAPGRLILGLRGNHAQAVGRTRIAEKTWHHLVITRNVNKIDLYLDGKEEVSMSLPESPLGPFERLTIGGKGDEIDTFEGKIDEVSLHSRALTPNEIKAFHKASGASK